MPIDPQRIQSVFLAATEVEGPAERASFLDGACAGDADLRSRVEALLLAHGQPDSLLDRPTITPGEHDPDAVAGRNTANHAVENVNWNDAAEFCARLSRREKLLPFYLRAGDAVTPLDGTGYRLPSEAEWEFAFRAGTVTKYWSGDKDEDLARAGRFRGNSGAESGKVGRTHPVGDLEANPFGLFDRHGNVWEWVQDGWDPTSYGRSRESPAINPNSPFRDFPRRVLQGGYWGNLASGCRSSDRYSDDPTNRWYTLGFRVSLPVGAVKAAKREAPSLAPG